MDLNDLFAAGQATIELKHPLTGKPLMDDSTPPKPLSLTVLGHHTKEYKKLARAIGFAKSKRDKKDFSDLSFEDTCAILDLNEADEIELLASAVVDCNLFFNGKYVECTKENILSILSDVRIPWLLDQYVQEVNAGKVFFKS